MKKETAEAIMLSIQETNDFLANQIGKTGGELFISETSLHFYKIDHELLNGLRHRKTGIRKDEQRVKSLVVSNGKVSAKLKDESIQELSYADKATIANRLKLFTEKI